MTQTLPQIARTIAQAFTRPVRSSQPKTPLDYGMAFEQVGFPALDGLALSGWLIPAPAGTAEPRLVVMNHPLYCNKYGYVPSGPIGDLVPVHVEFLKTARHLHDAGYTVLSYDLRNHGDSADSPHGTSGIGAFEWQDAAGAMTFIASRPDLARLPVALVNHCMGANAAIRAMSLAPDLFAQVRALVAVQPISMRYMAEKMIPLFGGGSDLAEIDAALTAEAGLKLADMSPMAFLRDLRVPVLYAQVREDVLTSPEDVQAMHDQTPTRSELLWIEGPLNRFDGYNHFGIHPERMLAFLAASMTRQAERQSI
ncbi:alpha/beta hydrolase family protein [Gemmobacter denitrificans]|uniref:Alpha/beta fold hydrolase n=1 Tax=Gemmobacter denitrificans TaxID=3123040 RepID=A0ABU8BRY5_9RHOB